MSSRHLTLSPCWKVWLSALTLRCSSAGLPGDRRQAQLRQCPLSRSPRPGREGGWAALTEYWEVLLVVEATGCLCHTLEVHLALVAHAVHIGGAIGPRDAGHAPACLHIPATDVHHPTRLPFPSWGDSGPTRRLSLGHSQRQPSPISPARPGPHSPSWEPHSQSGPRTTMAPWKMPLSGIRGRPWRGLSVTLRESGSRALHGGSVRRGPSAPRGLTAPPPAPAPAGPWAAAPGPCPARSGPGVRPLTSALQEPHLMPGWEGPGADPHSKPGVTPDLLLPRELGTAGFGAWSDLGRAQHVGRSSEYRLGTGAWTAGPGPLWPNTHLAVMRAGMPRRQGLTGMVPLVPTAAQRSPPQPDPC